MIPLTIAFAVLGVIFVVGIFLTELEQFGWATLTLIGTVVAVQLLHVADIVGYVHQHALESLLYTVGYLVVGVAWSFIKWFSFLMKFRDKYRESRDLFWSRNGVALGQELPANLKEEWSRKLGYEVGSKPTASHNKSRITAWMAFWPCSLIGTLLNDPVKRLFKFLFNTFKALYQKMADHVFANEPDLK